jgi:hypothetical protein
MNRREFLAVAGSATALSTLNVNPLFAERTTSLYVTGLIMASFEDPQYLRLGFPKAAGHKATLDVRPQGGERKVYNIKGIGSLETTAGSSSRPKVAPELIRMQEIYGDGVRSKVNECPVVINIPYGAIRNIAAAEISPVRYTFVRADNGKEVDTFRARKVAESIKIDISSGGVLKLDNGKISIPLDNVLELHADHSPQTNTVSNSGNVFADHFHHYLHYLDRPPAADFDVLPKKLGGNSAPAPRVGNNFFFPEFFCFVVAI